MEWTVAIGVDTHRDAHVAVAVDRLGAQIDSREIATTREGYCSLLSWALELGVPAFAVEGGGSYGAGLVRFLERAGFAVYECERPRRQERRRGKSDLIDAALAAQRLAAGEGLSVPRGGGRREDLRLLLLERRSAVQARTAAINQLKALLVTAPDELRERLGALSGERLATTAARLRPSAEVITCVLRRLGPPPNRRWASGSGPQRPSSLSPAHRLTQCSPVAPELHPLRWTGYGLVISCPSLCGQASIRAAPRHVFTDQDPRKAAAVTNEIRRAKRELLEQLRLKPGDRGDGRPRRGAPAANAWRCGGPGQAGALGAMT
jgi:Transposase